MNIAERIERLEREFRNRTPDRPRVVAARLRRTINQSIPNNTDTAIIFNSTQIETIDTMVDLILFNTRITAPAPGYYLAGCNIRWVTNATGFRSATVRLNGSTPITAERLDPTATQSTDIETTTLYQMNTGDYIELIVYQNSGGNLDVLGTSDYSAVLWLCQVH